MIEVNKQCDIFDEANTGDAVCVTTNWDIRFDGKAVMGRGIALQAKNLCPGIDLKLASYLKEYGNRPFNLGLYNIKGKAIRIFSYPTKYSWKSPSDMTLICKSAELLVPMADKFKPNNILLPPVGCGNGKLQWKDVRNWLSLILDDRFKVYL